MATNKKRHPQAARPSEGTGEKAVPCGSCGEPLALSKWERWNGFLVECWSCHRLHGQSRRLKNVALAGLFLNVLSFWFVMRPTRALVFTLIFGAWIVGGGLLMPDRPSDALMLTYIGVTLMGPLIATVVAAVAHEGQRLQPVGAG